MSLIVQVPRENRLVAYTLLSWDLMKDSATIENSGTQEQVKLSECLPFSKALCAQMKANPNTFSPEQAQAILKAAQQLTIPPRQVGQITKAYREMLKAIVVAHGLPKGALAFVPTNTPPQKNRKDSAKKDTSSRGCTGAAQPLTPYEQRRQQDAQKRRTRHEEEQRLISQALENQMARETKRALASARYFETQVQKRRRQLEQQMKARAEQERAAARAREQQRQQMRSQLEQRQQARAADRREHLIYRQIRFSDITLPPRLGLLTPLRFLHWLPERFELELETELGTAFLPLATQLSFDPKFSHCLWKAMQAMTPQESLDLLVHCLGSTNFHSTPHAIQVLERLHIELAQAAEEDPAMRSRLDSLTPHLCWRQERCAEKYGYRATEIAQERADRAGALLGKGERQPSQHTLTMAAHRIHEWHDEMQGFTRFNPFEYK